MEKIGINIENLTATYLFGQRGIGTYANKTEDRLIMEKENLYSSCNSSLLILVMALGYLYKGTIFLGPMLR